MLQKTTKEHKMTDKQAQMLLEAIKIIIEKCGSKEEEIEALSRIQEKGIKKPQ